MYPRAAPGSTRPVLQNHGSISRLVGEQRTTSSAEWDGGEQKKNTREWAGTMIAPATSPVAVVVVVVAIAQSETPAP